MTAPDDRRRHPRHSIVTRVQIIREERVSLLWLTNLSLGGVYLAAVPAENPTLSPRTPCELAVSAAQGGPIVRCKGRVIRCDAGRAEQPPGIGILFEEIDDDNLLRLRELIVRASRSV